MVLPVVCPCGSGVTPRNDELDQALVETEGDATPELSKGCYDNVSVVYSVVEAMEATEGVACLQLTGSGEHSPLWVESIAISYPVEGGG